MEAPRLGAESGPQLLAYATAMAILDPSHICELYCSLQQHWTLNPLNEARDLNLHLCGDCIRSLTHRAIIGTP